MGFFSKLGKVFKKVIGVVAAVAAAVFIPGAGAFIGKALLGAAISIGASKLLAKRGADAPAGGDGGGRVQLPPATDNKLPVVYGSAWLGGPTIDAKISVDQKYMWYCIALCEKPDGQTISFDTANGVYYGGKKVNFGTNGAVASLSTNSDPVQTDTRMANKIYIWLFQNGAANAGVNTGGQTAIQIMSDSSTGGGIPANERWNGPIYTSYGESVKLDDMAFVIVRVEYNPDAGTTSLDTLQVKVTNNMGASNGARPGTVIYDYMTNTRYGCAIPANQIDDVNTPGTSLYNLNTYSNQTIQYIDTSGNPQTQPFRYRINGAVNTAASCLQNLQTMVDSCDSWLQYSEATGKWRVIINGPYSGLESSLFLVDSNNLIGGIQINPVDLNETYNQVEVAYPNKNIKDQTDYQVIDLTNPSNWSTQVYDDILSPNESVNRLNISLPLVNEAVQAKYLAARRLLQSREDLVISCDLDYSGIQIEAGDVIRVGQPDYGWGPISTNPANPYKLFRVSSVNEQTTEDGSLVASIEAFEYNATVYADNAITDFIPADNTGLTDPNVISQPCPPTIATFTDANALVTGFTVTSCVPDEGTVMYMDFNYGNNSNVQTHNLYRTVQSAGGIPFTNSDSANAVYNNVSITVNDLPAANYYWSATARNGTSGRYSNVSNIVAWGGAQIQPYNPIGNTGGLPGNVYRPNSIPANAISGSVGVTVQEEGANIITNGGILNFRGIGFDITAANSTRANIALDANLDISQRISGNNFSINEGNPQANLAGPLLPVDATANTTRNVPIYIIGVDPGVNNYYPYYQGTAKATAGSNGNNYYQANSTGAWTPATAAILTAGDNEDNWFAVCRDSFANNSLANNQTYFINAGFTAVTDTPGTVLQVVQGFKTGNNTYYFSDTNRMDTVEMLTDTTQYSWERIQSELFSNASTITGGAVLVRCITAGANVIFTSGSIASSKGQTPFI